ncbi:MAG: iron-containing alcohol dehydrogenase [Chloroflexi bacterium]|nr:iron-containing alcohol dehydrogenase [Chloroflexota bacterium]
MAFEFATAGQIVFGAGAMREAGPLAARMGKHVLVVTTDTPERAAGLFGILQAAGLTYDVFPILEEPTVERIQEGVALARAAGCDVVIGIGGGSVMDAGKAIAALVTNPGSPLDYLEVIGAGKPLSNPPLPCIAIPTTAGTGAEVTRNAVLASTEHRVKVSLRSPLMLPRAALIDPELTHTVPPGVTASTGMDALTQCLEPFVSHAASPLTDPLCADGMKRAARSLRRAYENGSDADARADMALVSLFGGLALANARLGAVHGFAGPLGGMYPIPHGVACAALLPHVMEANIRALKTRQPDSPSLRRYDEVARILTGRADAAAEDGAAWARDLGAALAIPPLSAFGIQADHFPEIVDKSARASSMKGNPITLTPDELTAILTAAL